MKIKNIFFILLVSFYLCIPSSQVFSNTGEFFLVQKFISGEPIISATPEIIPEDIGIHVILQRPSYISSGNNIDYVCDTEKTDCKVNMKLAHGDGDTISRKYQCRISSDFESDEFSKCNPNTIIIPKGKHDFLIQLIDISNSSIISEKNITILNPEVPQIVEAVDDTGETGSTEVGEVASETIRIDPNVREYLKINGVLVNPKGSDTHSEFIILKNTGSRTINITGIQIDDIVGKGSRPYIVSEKTILKSGASIKFLKSDTGISLGNTNDEVNILYHNTPIDSVGWNFQIPDGYIFRSGDSQKITSRVSLVRVIDGDTIVVKMRDGTKETVRLIGVDTPETKHPYVSDEKYGLEATEFMIRALKSGNITLHQSLLDYRDTYGRLLAYVYVGDNMLNQELITKGYAKTYTRYNFDYKEIFLELEVAARQKNIGIWYEMSELTGPEVLDQPSEELVLSPIEVIESVSEPVQIREEKNQLKIKFRKTIVLQKKSVKIYGETIPNTTIQIAWGGEKYEIISDETGKYSTKFISIKPGSFVVDFSVLYEGKWQYIKSSEIMLSSEYVSKVYQANKPKTPKNTILQHTNLSEKSQKLEPDSVLNEGEYAEEKTGETDFNSEKPSTHVGFLYTVLYFMSLGGLHMLLKRGNMFIA